jgi:hypothetical protein
MYYILIERNNDIDTLEFNNIDDTNKVYLDMCYYYGHDNVRVEDENGLEVEF